MKKTTRYIIILAVVLVALGGVLALLYFTDPSHQTAEEESSTSSQADTSLIAREANTLKQVEVKSADRNFKLLAAKSEDEEGNEEMSYSIEGYEDYPFKENNLRGAAGNFTSLSYTKLLGPESDYDLGEYGLDQGITATATYEDGSKETLVIGTEPGETAGRYVLYEGTVYICSINQVYTTELKDQLEVASWSIAKQTDEAGYEYSYLEKFSISGTNFPRAIEIEYSYDDLDYNMVEPIRSGGSITFCDTLVEALASFDAGTVVQMDPTQEDLKGYGFDTPYADMSFTINGESHSIVVGNKVENMRYIMVDGNKKIVYQISAETIAPWADSKEEKFRDGYVNILMITKVNKITVEGNGNKTVIDLARTVNEEKSTDESTVYDYTAKRDGVDMVYKNVTKFYSDLISISILNMQETDITGDPLLSITYEYYDGSQPSVLEFYQSTESEDRCIVLIDGEYNSTVRMSSVEKVWSSLEKFIALDPTVEIDSL